MYGTGWSDERGTTARAPVTRTYERLEGLAVSGQASLGPLLLPLPSILWSRPPDLRGGSGDRVAGAVLSDRGDATPGHRSLEVSDGTSTVHLGFPVGTPEVTGASGELFEAAPRIWVLHWPIAEEEWVRLRASDPEAVVLANSRTLFSEGALFVRAVGEVRSRLGGEPILWTPRTALPHRLAALAYLGVDLVDSTEARFRSAEGEFLTVELGPFDRVDAAAERGCGCPSCAASADLASGGHAEWLLEREMRLVRSALRAGRLRELVEARLTAEPVLAEILRYADQILGRRDRGAGPVIGDGSRNYILKESQRRPEMVRFRNVSCNGIDLPHRKVCCWWCRALGPSRTDLRRPTDVSWARSRASQTDPDSTWRRSPHPSG